MRRALALALIVGSSIAMAAPAKKKKKRTHARKAIAHSTQKKSEPKVERSEKEPTDPSRLDNPKDIVATPAYRYGAMSRGECLAELKKRKIAFTREGDTRGVLAPVRLAGPLHGITFRTNQPEKRRATSPWEIGDCRLILAVDDFAAVLATRDIVEVIHYSMYRNKLKSSEDEWGRRHPGGLALDAAKFIKKDGAKLVVDEHFNGAIDDKTCGEGSAPHPETPEALELRAIVCAAAEQHLFNVILTPNYNKAHHNHFHLEVTPGVKWFLLH